MNTQTGRTWATRTPGGVVVVCASEAEARWMHRSPTWTSVDLLTAEQPAGPGAGEAEPSADDWPTPATPGGEQ